jgi:hypothetical protein
MTASSSPRFAGIQPRFPGLLGRWRWLNETVPAERAAALRIAVAIALLFDLGVGSLPHFNMMFTAEGLAGRSAYPLRFREGHHHWSLLRSLPDSWGPQVLMAVWIIAAIGLLAGYRPFISGLVCWMCGISFWNIDPWVCNGGDQLRNILLIAVAVSRSGAVWGVQSVRRNAEAAERVEVFVPGWPFKVLIVQFVCLYFFSGIYKLQSPDWRSGNMMYYVDNDLAWSLLPNITTQLPEVVHRLGTWVTLVWEIGFPILFAWKRTRAITLWIGFLFHLLTFLTLEVGHFALYSMAWYAVFVPWERYGKAAPPPGTINASRT